MKKLDPVHPGEYLRETLQELDISARQFAFHIGTTPMRLSLVLRGLRPVSANLALRLEKALGQSAGYWMNLQTRYDLDVAFDRTSKELTAIRPLERIHA
ncbi:addiction module antidote protein, HigA family [Desulfonatronum zhilinae]|nr:addiction module antidote protein, HigA family [Desulfonatronum zhilinae]